MPNGRPMRPDQVCATLVEAQLKLMLIPPAAGSWRGKFRRR